MRRRALVAIALVLCACPNGGGRDRTCGAPEDAEAAGLAATIEGTTFTYGDFTAGHARDCGLASTTISGVQKQPVEGGPFTLCVVQGDQLGDETLDLADAAEIDLVDVFADDGACTTTLDFAQAPRGSVTFVGYCDEGGATFLLTIDGSAPGLETCGADPAVPVTIDLSGSAIVSFPTP